MTKEALLKRIEVYRNDMASIRKQAEAELNALNGAIKDCEHWLSELEKDGQEEAP